MSNHYYNRALARRAVLSGSRPWTVPTSSVRVVFWLVTAGLILLISIVGGR